MKTLEEEAEKWVFETNGHKWSNNDDTAGDNYGSFIAGANSKHIQAEKIKAQIDAVKKTRINGYHSTLNKLEKELKDLDS